MMFPPSVLRLRVAEHGQKKIRLWVPLFLLWPIAIVFVVLLTPLVLIAALVMWNRDEGRILLRLGPRLFELLCAMRGLKVHVENPKEQVYITFW